VCGFSQAGLFGERVGGQSAVALDTKAVDGFFEKMKNGTLTSADFYQGPGGPVG